MSIAVKFKFLKDLVSDSYNFIITDNTFTAFTSKDNILYLIYINQYNSFKNGIIFFNLLDNKKITEIKEAHSQHISNVRHFFDKSKIIDIIMSISLYDSNIKLWNVHNLECITNIMNAYEDNWLNSACILYANNKNYIIAGCYQNEYELIKVFDFNGNELKKINDSNDDVVIIDTYYDNIFNKNYIITGNNGYVKSFIFEDNILYHKYHDNSNKHHFSIVIFNKEENIKLIESSTDGFVRIWNFHTGVLLSKIQINKKKALYGICLWNTEFLIVGCINKSIKIVELNNNKIIQELNRHKGGILTIKKIEHPKFGECLISQGNREGMIKLWGCTKN